VAFGVELELAMGRGHGASIARDLW
jgi:hypothetical protein